MTIRRSVDLAAINAEYTLFLDGCEAAPDRMFLQAKDIRDRVIGYCADEIVRVARASDIVACPCDGIREIEILMFDMVRRMNPVSEIEGAIGLGRSLEAAVDDDSRRSIVSGLVRDRDFVESMRARSAA